MENKSKLKKLILKSAYITVIVLIIAVIALIILKYNVEGEKNMPFKLSSIIVVSNAEGYQKEENKNYKWDADIYQINDVYLNIEKNKNYKEEEIIKSVVIENIKIEEPQVGKTQIYRAANENNNLFVYNDEYKITDKVEYIGNKESDLKNLKIANQGNTLVFRILNKTERKYISNEEEFKHSGKLLEKVGLTYDEIKFTASFDLVINLESDISFRANIKLDLPTGNIIKEGTSSLEIKDMKNIVFKREQK